MKAFVAIEFNVNKETGRKETYLAEDIKEAVGKVLYTRQLTDGSYRVGQNGQTVLNGSVTWVVLPD